MLEATLKNNEYGAKWGKWTNNNNDKQLCVGVRIENTKTPPFHRRTMGNTYQNAHNGKLCWAKNNNVYAERRAFVLEVAYKQPAAKRKITQIST